MILLRAFIAVDIPPEIQHNIHLATAELQKKVGLLVRWTPTENIHLTMKFLGDISPTNVEYLTQMLRAEVDSFNCFDIHLGGLGSFPSRKRPRVIYIGIQAPAELDALRRGIESASRRLGYESEERGFSPHLTIGRVKQNASALEQHKICRAFEETTMHPLGAARVDAVHLYRSDLRPTGSVYTQMFSAPLKKI